MELYFHSMSRLHSMSIVNENKLMKYLEYSIGILKEIIYKPNEFHDTKWKKLIGFYYNHSKECSCWPPIAANLLVILMQLYDYLKYLSPEWFINTCVSSLLSFFVVYLICFFILSVWSYKVLFCLFYEYFLFIFKNRDLVSKDIKY